MKVSFITLVVATWVLAGCEAAVPPAKMAPLGGLDPDTKALVIISADISPKHPTWNFTVPACGWYGVHCNATTGRVTHITWNTMGLFGTPCLDSLPEYLVDLRLSYNYFSGTPDLTSLNQGLYFLALNNNCFSGTPDLTSLPGVCTCTTTTSAGTGRLPQSHLPILPLTGATTITTCRRLCATATTATSTAEPEFGPARFYPSSFSRRTIGYLYIAQLYHPISIYS